MVSTHITGSKDIKGLKDSKMKIDTYNSSRKMLEMTHSKSPSRMSRGAIVSENNVIETSKEG